MTRKPFLVAAIVGGLFARGTMSEAGLITHFTDNDAGDSNWTTAGNWDNGVPSSADDAFIAGGNTTLLITASGQGANSLTIAHDGVTLPGDGTLTQTGVGLSISQALNIGMLENNATGVDISGAYTVDGNGTLTVGTVATGRADLYLGYNAAGNTFDAVGTLDLSSAAQFDAYLRKLSLGEVTVSGGQNGRGQGILKLPALSNIDADEIVVSSSNGFGVNQPTSKIELGTTSNFTVDSFTVGGFRGMAEVEFASGGTLTLAGSSGAEADLLIANCPTTNYAANGHMDMSGGTFNATLDQLLIGYDQGGPARGGTVGKLTFNAGTIAANSLTLGDADSDGLGNGTLDMSGGSLTVNGDASLGTGTSVSLGTINLSGGAITVNGSVVDGAGTGTLNVDGGTFAVSNSSSANQLVVDGLRVGSGSTTGTLNIESTGGSSAVNTDVVLANGGGSGGTINLSGGSFDVAGSVTDGGGDSTVNVDAGTLTVGGDLKVDTLRVGYLASGVTAHRSGTVTVTGGGDVAIGSAANRTDLYLGYNTANNNYNAVGTLDLTGAARLDAYLGKLSLGEVTVGGSRDGRGQGILKLPDVSHIDAREILVSWSNAYGRNQPTSTIELGTTSNFNVDTFTVGGFRGFALVEFASSGTLTLTGSSGAEADLLIADCDPTNYAANGHMDMSAGTFNATLDQLQIGYDGSGPNNGGSVGKLTFNAGNIAANSLTLGDADSDGRGIGTLDMSGGSLTVNGNASLGTGTSVSLGTISQTGGTITVTGDMTGGIGSSTVDVSGGTLSVAGTIDVDSFTLDGSGVIDAGTINVTSGATFDSLGGTLHVDNFTGDLLQQGSTLAPGNSIGTTTITGDFTLNSGSLEIEIGGTAGAGAHPDGWDQLIVNGDVALGASANLDLIMTAVLDPADVGSYFTIIDNINASSLNGTFLQGTTITGYYSWWGVHDFDIIYNYDGGGDSNFNDVALYLTGVTVIPEPSAVTALLVLMSLGLHRRRRRRRLTVAG